jgi:uncharacterized membrane protein YbhN (UPF0104 family)
MLSVPQSLLIGGMLILIDLWARSYRLQVLLAGVGVAIRTRQACVTTAFGDAASVLTPLRFGGTPARLAVLHRYHVPVSPGVGAVALDLATYQAMLLLIGGAFAAQVAPHLLARPLSWSPPPMLIAMAAAVPIVVVGVARRSLHGRFKKVGAQMRALSDRVKSDPGFWRTVVVSLILAAVSIGARVSLLPLLALSLPPDSRPPELSALAFAVTFGQVLIPTPSGAGAVELAFAASGFASTPGMASVFVAWRALTVGLVAVLGLTIVVVACGKGIFAAAIVTHREGVRKEENP